MGRDRATKWRTYRRRREDVLLLNDGKIPLLTSALMSFALTFWAETQTLEVLAVSAQRLPGALLAIIGFVLTAIAIMSAAESRSVAGTLRDRDDDTWQDIIDYFSRTAKIAAVLAAALAILPVTWPALFDGESLWQPTATFVLAAFVIWVGQLLLGSLALLERGVTKHPAKQESNEVTGEPD